MAEDTQYENYQRGRDAMEAGDYELALDLFLRSASVLVHFKTYESIGECYLKLGRPRDAVVYLAGAAGLGNKQVRPYFTLATALKDIGDLEQAKEMLNKALSINPDYRRASELLSAISE